MIIKKTFSSRVFDWIIIGTTLIFLVLNFIKLFSGYQYIYSDIFPRLIFFLLSLNAVLSFVIPNVDGERMTHLFLGGVLILPSIVPIFQFLAELIFKQNFLISLLVTPFFYLNLFLGSILLFFSIKFTRKKKSKREKNLGIFLAGVGVYVLLYLLVKSVESNFRFVSGGFVLWEVIVKVVLGISLVITGMQVRYRKLNYSMGLILTALVFVLFFVLNSE